MPVLIFPLRVNANLNLAHKKLPPPQDHPRALGKGLLQGPIRRQFIMSEVSLYGAGSDIPAAGEGQPQDSQARVRIHMSIVMIK